MKKCKKSAGKKLILFRKWNIIDYYDKWDVAVMKFLSTTECSKKWNISARRISTLCAEGRIPDVQRVGSVWMIPENAEKPSDARVKTGKYVKK